MFYHKDHRGRAAAADTGGAWVLTVANLRARVESKTRRAGDYAAAVAARRSSSPPLSKYAGRAPVLARFGQLQLGILLDIPANTLGKHIEVDRPPLACRHDPVAVPLAEQAP